MVHQSFTYRPEITMCHDLRQGQGSTPDPSTDLMEDFTTRGIVAVTITTETGRPLSQACSGVEPPALKWLTEAQSIETSFRDLKPQLLTIWEARLPYQGIVTVTQTQTMILVADIIKMLWMDVRGMATIKGHGVRTLIYPHPLPLYGEGIQWIETMWTISLSGAVDLLPDRAPPLRMWPPPPVTSPRSPNASPCSLTHPSEVPDSLGLEPGFLRQTTRYEAWSSPLRYRNRRQGLVSGLSEARRRALR